MNPPGSSSPAECVQKMFDAAMDLSGVERERYLDDVCSGDPALRREVESLVDAFEARAQEVLGVLENLPVIVSANDEDMVGRRVGHYAIQQKLGVGGMGVVYKARDTKLDRVVALKFLPPHLTFDKPAKDRFVREARAASALDHSNICTIHEIGETDDGQLFIAMACYEGETLKEKIERGPLPLEEAVGYAVQIAEGLERAHGQGIIHRDIKPANMIVADRGQVKILDFGLAKVADVDLTLVGGTYGTVNYMSPEQALGHSVDHRTDLWSLGVVLYEMLAGERPFRGESADAVLYAIRNDDPAPLRDRRPDIPDTLDQLVRRLLRKDPAERYISAADVADELRATATARAASRRASGRTYRIAAVSAAVILLGATAVFLADRHRIGVSEAVGEGPPISVAVLPVVNLSADSEQDFFSDGMTDALISDLGTVGALSVISRTSVMRYRNTTKTLPEIARDLNVTHIVEGSALHAEGKVRIVARLVEAATDRQLWSDTYEKELKDIVSLQREIARSIAGTIGVRLTPQQQAHLTAAPATDPEAYTAYLHGLFYWNNRPPLEKAVEYFERAISLDPGFAAAHAMLAGCYAIGGPGALSRRETARRAREAIASALALDETSAEAYNMLGWVNVYFDWDWDGAERAFKRALELNPSYADAYHRYAHFLMIMGRAGEALESSRRARDLNPFDRAIAGHHVWDLYMTRQYDRAIEYSRRILDADPDNFNAFSYALPAYERSGRAGEILSFDSNMVRRHYRARALAIAGRTEEARVVIHEMLRSSGLQNAPLAIAYAYEGLGETDSSFHWLEVAFSTRAYPLPDIRIDPALDRLRRDPRFPVLLRRMGLTDAGPSESHPTL